MAKTPDLSEFEDANAVTGGDCAVAKLREKLAVDPDKLAKFDGALAAPKTRIQHSAISRVLAGWGYKVRPETIGRHRGGQCACRN